MTYLTKKGARLQEGMARGRGKGEEVTDGQMLREEVKQGGEKAAGLGHSPPLPLILESIIDELYKLGEALKRSHDAWNASVLVL